MLLDLAQAQVAKHGHAVRREPLQGRMTIAVKNDKPVVVELLRVGLV